MRSDVVGASLSWPFTATAVLVGLGRGPEESGLAEIRVDDRAPLRIELGAPEAAWIDHVVARDLGAGAHRVTVTLRSGRVAVDRLAAGVETRGGAAEAILRRLE